MRLNRVLLLAASFICMVFAMVFTISCSGDDGKDGKSCTVEKKDGTSYDVICDGKIVGELGQGPKGDNGLDAPGAVENNCVLGARVGDSFQIVCGTTVINPGSGGSVPGDICVLGTQTAPGVYNIKCGDIIIEGEVQGSVGGCKVEQDDIYNNQELAIRCSGSSAIYTCGGRVFDKEASICLNGYERILDKNYRAYSTNPNCGDGTAVKCDFGVIKSAATVGSVAGTSGTTDAILADTSLFRCFYGADRKTYNPNKYYCKMITSNTLDSLVELCGPKDYNNGTHFCFQGSSGAKMPVKRCGGQPFNFNQFCKTDVDNSSYPTITYTSYANGVVTSLCNGSYDKIELDGNDEIKTKVGGEFYAVTTGATGGVSLTGKANTYVAGTSICQNGVVMTQCSKGTPNTTTNQVLYYDAKTEFCRDTTVFSATFSVEKAPLCFKTSDPKQQGNVYDGKVYFCNSETGLGQRKCADTFFDEDTYFCYGAGSLATPILAPYCLGTGLTQYDPREAFCSFLSTSYLKTDMKSEKTSLCNRGTGATATPLIKYNISQWNWEYCTNETPDGVLRCGDFQRPGATGDAGIPAADVGKVCICIDGADGSTISKCTCPVGGNNLYDRQENKCVSACPGGGSVGRDDGDRCYRVDGTVISGSSSSVGVVSSSSTASSSSAATCSPGIGSASACADQTTCNSAGGLWNNMAGATENCVTSAECGTLGGTATGGVTCED